MSEHRLRSIVIERPRQGMRISLRKVKGFKKQLNQLTEEATEDGLLSPYLIKPRNKTKSLSDCLGPLRRFLRSKVGQPWDDVYSELCRQLDTKTMAGQHVLSHLWHYVERHVESIDGIFYSKSSSVYRTRLDRSRYEQFYVHPETGILCASAKIPRKNKQPKPNLDVVSIDGYHQYRKINNIWYLVTFADFPTSSDRAIDILHGQIDHCKAIHINGRNIYAVSKRQCNKKEIKLILNRLAKSEM